MEDVGVGGGLLPESMKTLEELFSELQPLTADRNHKEALPVIERSQLLY